MTTPTSDDLARAFRAEAGRLGFVAVGIAGAELAPEASARLKAWLDAGCHGTMQWMGRPQRESPKALWAEVRTAIMLGFPYTPAHDPFRNAGKPALGTISVYALGADYHDVIKPRLKSLARWLLAAAGGGDAKVFVDTAPLMEKSLAEAAGIGWQGKHSNLLSRTHGNWLFLAAILTTLDLSHGGEAGAKGSCGTCTRCIDACPTDALTPYEIDASRCISYLTIELREEIPAAFADKLEGWAYGCDICQEVCPWNRFSVAHTGQAFKPLDFILDFGAAEWEELDERTFKKLTRHSAMSRVKWEKMKGNLKRVRRDNKRNADHSNIKEGGNGRELS